MRHVLHHYHKTTHFMTDSKVHTGQENSISFKPINNVHKKLLKKQKKRRRINPKNNDVTPTTLHNKWLHSILPVSLPLIFWPNRKIRFLFTCCGINSYLNLFCTPVHSLVPILSSTICFIFQFGQVIYNLHLFRFKLFNLFYFYNLGRWSAIYICLNLNCFNGIFK